MRQLKIITIGIDSNNKIEVLKVIIINKTIF